MNELLKQTMSCREKAEALRANKKWAEAATAYEALAKAWIAAAGVATSATARAERLVESDKALEMASKCLAKVDRSVKAGTDGSKRVNGSGNQNTNDQGDDIGDAEEGNDGDDGDGSQIECDADGPPESEFLVADRPAETLDDIMGMVEAKREVEDFLNIVSDPEGAKKFNLRASSGLLLYGPPGNGKTMFGKAIANRVDAPFYYASGATIRSKWVGESSQRLHALFRYARRHPVAVIFFDEIETLIPKRRENTHDADKQIVTQFLQEVGGFVQCDSKIFLLAATNCPWDIDDAAFRTGRFDLKIFIGAPDEEARLGMLQRSFKGVELASDVDLVKWAQRLDLYTGSDIAGLAEQARKTAYRRYRADHSDLAVRESDLENAIGQITRSITPELFKKYEDFAKSRS